MQKEMEHIMGMIDAGGGRVPAVDVIRSIESSPELRRENYPIAKQALRREGKLHAHNARDVGGNRVHDLVAGRNPAKSGGEA